jgi:hypothetical protein
MTFVLRPVAELADVREDLRRGFHESAVQQDVALGGRDQEGRDLAGAHVVDVSGLGSVEMKSPWAHGRLVPAVPVCDDEP